jgi:hypothetical protein
MQDVCRKYKVGRTTLWTWLQHPAFQARLTALRHQAVDAALGRLSELLGKASDTYARLLDAADTPPRIKLDTANAVLDRFVGLSNFAELRAEIEKLKAQLPEGKR